MAFYVTTDGATFGGNWRFDGLNDRLEPGFVRANFANSDRSLALNKSFCDFPHLRRNLLVPRNIEINHFLQRLSTI
jgi:hypothetical protein